MIITQKPNALPTNQSSPKYQFKISPFKQKPTCVYSIGSVAFLSECFVFVLLYPLSWPRLLGFIGHEAPVCLDSLMKSVDADSSSCLPKHTPGLTLLDNFLSYFLNPKGKSTVFLASYQSNPICSVRNHASYDNQIFGATSRHNRVNVPKFRHS